MKDWKYYAISEKQLNPKTVKVFDESMKPHYEFGGYEPELNPAYSIQESILAMVIDTQEALCVNAIKLWAREKGYDDVILMDEAKLKEIIRLGSAEYERLHGEDCDDGWIPCKERLPEEKINPITDDFYEYEVTFKQGTVTDIRHYKFGRGHWWNYGMLSDDCVVAWREHLEPYHEP